MSMAASCQWRVQQGLIKDSGLLLMSVTVVDLIQRCARGMRSCQRDRGSRVGEIRSI